MLNVLAAPPPALASPSPPGRLLVGNDSAWPSKNATFVIRLLLCRAFSRLAFVLWKLSPRIPSNRNAVSLLLRISLDLVVPFAVPPDTTTRRHGTGSRSALLLVPLMPYQQ